MPPSTLRKYRIPPGKSINVTPPTDKRSGVVPIILTGPHPSGRVVTADEVPSAKIAGYIRNGFLIQLGEATPDLTGIEGAVLGNDSVRESVGHQVQMPLTKPEEVGMKAPKRSRPRSIWDTAPEKLLGKDLETLNFMVKERDATMEPFDDPAEAIAQLTKDYQGPIG